MKPGMKILDNMKKAATILTLILMPIFAWGQAQINTKKVKIGDFTQKVTKVVLSGNAFLDSVLQDEVTLRWRISPYEFCTLEEFGKLNTDDNYYFLLTTHGQFKNENKPTIQFLTLVKGGPEAKEGISRMLEVVSMPLASSKYPTGREIIFLPAFIDIIQNYTLDSMERDANAYGGLANYTSQLPKASSHKLVFSENDLSEKAAEAVRTDDQVIITDEDSADLLLQNNEENTLVSYVVAPYVAVPGSYCYKMLIDTQTHRLYYYRRDKVTKTRGAGFLPEEISRILSSLARKQK